MTYRGKVSRGVIVLEPGVQLPEGAAVEVELIGPEEDVEAELDPLYRIAELAAETGIPDLSVNIDHYLYGHPKVVDDQDHDEAEAAG